jgi:prophage regulatory protein
MPGVEKEVSLEAEPGERLLRLRDVEVKVAIGKSTIYLIMKEGRFPRPIELAPQLVRWRSSDLDAWIKQLRPDAGV